MSRKLILTLATAATIAASALASSAADARGFGGGGGGFGHSVGIGRIGGGGLGRIGGGIGRPIGGIHRVAGSPSRSFCRPAIMAPAFRLRGGTIITITGIGGSATAAGSPLKAASPSQSSARTRRRSCRPPDRAPV